jgi:SSS family solute:Na+ symporter
VLGSGAGIGLVLMLRWYWWRVNAWSEITAMVAPAVGFLYLSSGSRLSPQPAKDHPSCP